jgi:quercetin dioxygenase-like cupin family protein
MKASTTDRIVRFADMELRFRVDETDGEGNVVMFDWIVEPHARVPARHFHESADEIVYGLEGTLTTTVDGKVHEVRAGDVVFVHRGAVHQHENVHDEVAKVLIVLTPGTIGRRYFEEIADVVNVPGPPDIALLKDIMQRHGLVPA